MNDFHSNSNLMPRDRSAYRYQACFCEENIWHLVRTLADEQDELAAQVLFFINANQQVRMAQQRAFGPGGVGFWDYHVVLHLTEERTIVDFDTLLGFQTPVAEYFRKSFPKWEQLPDSWRAIVRQIAAADYLRDFSSDRSHMLDANGRPLAAFPDWPTIENDVNPLRLVDLRDAAFDDQRIVDRSLGEFVTHGP